MQIEEKRENLPEKRYERSMNHNYLILSTYYFFGEAEEDYTTKMVLGNKIHGLLPVICRQNTGEKQYCYEINSLQSLDRLYEKQEIGYEALRKLLAGCICIFERLEEYLLDGTQILLNPEYIYVHMDTNEPFLVCYPEYHGEIRQSFQELMDYLLTKIDHTQEQTVWLAYQAYRYTRNPNYVLSEIKELLYEVEEMREISESEKGYCKTEVSVKEEISDSQGNDLAVGNKGHFYRNDEEENYDDIGLNEDKKEEEERYSWNRNILGALLCTLLTLSAVGIIFGSRLLKLISLSPKQEVSLYGAIGMSVVAAVIFFVSLVKGWKKELQMKEPSTESDKEAEYWEQNYEQSQEYKQGIENEERQLSNRFLQEQDSIQHTSKLTGATMLFNQESVTERCLKGVVNGEEVCVPLKHFPLTLGKLAGFSDFVIPDNTVSRMHARLQQRNGQIYISDLNSTNGTIRNGDMLAINEEVAMELGDQIILGRVCFTYC